MRGFIFNEKPTILESVCTANKALNSYLASVGASYFHEVLQPRDMKILVIENRNEDEFILKAKIIAKTFIDANKSVFTADQAISAYLIILSYFLVYSGCGNHRLQKTYLHYLSCQLGTIVLTVLNNVSNHKVLKEVQDLDEVLRKRFSAGIKELMVFWRENMQVGRVAVKHAKWEDCDYCNPGLMMIDIVAKAEIKIIVKAYKFVPLVNKEKGSIEITNVTEHDDYQICTYAHIVQFLERYKNVMIEQPFISEEEEMAIGYLNNENTFFELIMLNIGQ